MIESISLQDLKEQFQQGQLAKPDFIRQALAIHRQLFNYVQITQHTDVNEICINPMGVNFRIGKENIQMFAPEEEARVAPIEIMNFGRYEPEVTYVMDLLVSGATHILDIGANIGWYSLHFAKTNPTAQIHAFEPIPSSYFYLQKNIALNGLGAQVLTYNYGLSETNGSVEFFIAPTNGTNASLANVANVTNTQKIIGLTLTLNQWCTNQQIKPNFIKCDVEGAELLVFRGGRDVLLCHKPIIFTELLRKWSKPFGYHPNDMLKFFHELGYVCYGIGSNGVRPIQEVTDATTETNYTFVHSQSHKSAISVLENLK